MAGGAASRFGRKVEKGVLKVGGKTLLERSVSAMMAEGVESFCVAVTETTPETERLARGLGADVLRTSGSGYHEDTLELMEELGRFICLNVDVPFVTSEHVGTLITRSTTGSAAAVVPVENAIVRPERGAMMIGPDGRTMVWVGLNIVSDDADTGLIVFEDGVLCVNVNDDESLDFADRMSRERRL